MSSYTYHSLYPEIQLRELCIPIEEYDSKLRSLIQEMYLLGYEPDLYIGEIKIFSIQRYVTDMMSTTYKMATLRFKRKF